MFLRFLFSILLLASSTQALAKAKGISPRLDINTVEEHANRDAEKLTQMISQKIGEEVNLSDLECSQHESGLVVSYVGICTVNAATIGSSYDFLVTFKAMVTVSEQLFPKPPLPPTKYVILDSELIHED